MNVRATPARVVGRRVPALDPQPTGGLRGNLWLLALVWLVLGWPQPALAQDTSDLEALLEEQVVTTASKTAESSSRAPATVSTITADDLRRYGIRSVDEAIRFLSMGATMSDSSRTPEFGARGVTFAIDKNTHVLVLVDGHSVNEQASGSALLDRGLGVPIEIIDRIEVILGPGAVLYGTNAMLAVVNIITETPAHHRGLHATAEVELGALARASVGFGRQFELFGEPAAVSWQLEATKRRRPVSLREVDEGTDPWTGLPVQTRPNHPADGIWGGTWEHNYARGPALYSRLQLGDLNVAVRTGAIDRNNPYMQFDFDSPDAVERERWLSIDTRYARTLSTHASLLTRLYSDLSASGMFYRSSAPLYCLPGMLRGCYYDMRASSRTVGLELQPTLDWFKDGREVTTVGIDGRVRRAGTVVNVVEQGTGFTPGSSSFHLGTDGVLGVYAQHVAELDPRLVLNLGARSDVDTRAGSALSPRIAVIVLPWQGGALKSIYNSAFRSPSIAEQYAVLPLLLAQADPLEPERLHAIEQSLEQRFGTQTLVASLFYEAWRDMVVMSPLSAAELQQEKQQGQIVPYAPRAFKYRNAASVESYGITLGWQGKSFRRRLGYGVNVTSSHVRRSYDDRTPVEMLPASPERYGNAHVSYDPGGGWPTFGLAGHVKARQTVALVAPGTFQSAPTVPSRLVLQANVTGPVPAADGLSYRLGVWVANRDRGPLSPAMSGPGTTESGSPVPDPLETFRLLAGVQYDMPL